VIDFFFINILMITWGGVRFTLSPCGLERVDGVGGEG
jgi:hypothetical protein